MPIADSIMNTKIMHYLKMIREMNCWSADHILDWQNQRLKKLIIHAYCNTKYYNNLFNSLNLKPGDFNSIKDLEKLPILTKKNIQNNYSDFIPINIRKISYHKTSTGGSTGNPLLYLLDNESWSFEVASNFYYWSKIGYGIGDRYVALGSSSLFPVNKKSIKHDIYYRLKGKVPLNAMNLSDKVLIDYLNFIKKNKVRFIYGYASAVYLIAKKAVELNFDLPLIKGCITTSEILLDVYRTTIEAAFRCPIIDAYGAADGGIYSFSVKKGIYNVLYSCILEVDGKRINNGKTGEVLSTDLFNYALPFIRYQVGDEVTLLNRATSKCKYNGQIITEVLGRIPDIIKLKNGHVLTAPGFTILFRNIKVNAYNIRQINELEILCEIQPKENYSKYEETLIINTLKKHAGNDCKINIEYKKFDLASSGKRRYFISA